MFVICAVFPDSAKVWYFAGVSEDLPDLSLARSAPGLLLSLVLVPVSAGAGLSAAPPAFFLAFVSGLAANKIMSANWQQKRAAKAALPYLDTIRNNCRSKSTEKLSAGADLWQFWGVELKNPSACAIMGLRHQQNNTAKGASSYASSV